MNPEQEIQFLREQVRDLTMRLSAIKIITAKITPLCADKLRKMLEECEGCSDGNTESD